MRELIIKDILYNHWLFEIRRDGNKEEAYFFSKSLKRRLECMDEKKKKDKMLSKKSKQSQLVVGSRMS